MIPSSASLVRVPLLAALCAALALGCGSSESSTDAASGGADAAATDSQGAAATGPLLLTPAHTLRVGQADNAEVVRLIPGQRRALLLSSKARKVTLLAVDDDRLRIVREATLFADDPSESELTHAEISSDGTWAVATRTLIEVDADGAQTDCGGELVFLDVRDADTFGAILRQVEVGPMPDNVDISADDRVVVSANERDGPDAWGKCTRTDEVASISVVDVGDDPAGATERVRIPVADHDGTPREPESLAIAADDDLVMVTLQDSHELAMFRLSAVAGTGDPAAALQIVRLPDDDLGAGPWPDGVAGLMSSDDGEIFVVAGEWNDTLTVLDATGEVLASVPVAAADLPTTLPRVVDEGSPLFSPDSVAPFTWQGMPQVAVTLRHAGAVALYDLSDPRAPRYVSAAPVGADEAGGQDEDGSTVRPEGVAAAPDGSFVLTANEGESSVTLLVPSR